MSDAVIVLPPEDAKWVINEASTWPKITYEDLVDYLVMSKAYDGKEMKAFRSLYAYNYVQNGWLGNILYYKSDSIHYLKANVSPSQPGVGRSDYSAWFAAGDDGSILTGHCTCPAGAGRSCSHISAIVYAVSLAWSHGVAGETCTDKARLWGHGAGKAVLQEKFEDIDFNRPKPDAAPVVKETMKNTKSSTLPKTVIYYDHSDLQEHANDSCTNILWTCKGTLLNKILTAKKRTVKEQLPLEHTCHEIDGSKPVKEIQCQPCKKFYNSYINFSNEAKANITQATTSQSSPLWQDVRKLRISSSKVNALPKTSRADPNKFITNQIYPRFKGNSATQHGLRHEAEARSWFEKTTGTHVIQTGIVIDQNEPYLAASPDGIVDKETILEIKCPTKSLNELIQGGKYDIVYNDNGYSLKPNGRNGYYTQVQIAMHCTRRSMCKFVVWTKTESVIADVPYDASFVEGTLSRIRKFYFQHLLVRLADENHSKRLKICDQYRRYCQV